MLQNNPVLKSKIEQLWDKFWSGPNRGRIKLMNLYDAGGSTIQGKNIR